MQCALDGRQMPANDSTLPTYLARSNLQTSSTVLRTWRMSWTIARRNVKDSQSSLWIDPVN